MIKIQFPHDDMRAARILGHALLELAGVPAEASTRTPEPLTTDVPAEAVTVVDEVVGTGTIATPEGYLVDPVTGDIVPAEGFGGLTPPTDVERDLIGVAFNAEFCGKSDKPFYTSGPREGQWKKKRGVPEPAYDAWYGGARIDAVQATGDAPPATVDASGAFGPGEGAADPAPTGPTNCGEFFAWAAAQQAAGHFTGEQVQAAYANTGIVMTDLFAPATDEDVAERVAQLVAVLTS